MDQGRHHFSRVRREIVMRGSMAEPVGRGRRVHPPGCLQGQGVLAWDALRLGPASSAQIKLNRPPSPSSLARSLPHSEAVRLC